MKILTALCAFLCTTAVMAETIEIIQPYARSASPNAKSGAAFMIINNTGEKDVTLTGGETEYAERAEIHTHNMTDDGIMKMMEVEGGLVVPAGQCVTLSRGGYHVMLLGLTKPILDGETFELALNFENIEPIKVDIKIDREFVQPEESVLPEGQESCLNAMGSMKHSVDHMKDMDHSDMNDHDMEHEHH